MQGDLKIERNILSKAAKSYRIKEAKIQALCVFASLFSLVKNFVARITRHSPPPQPLHPIQPAKQ